MLKKIIYAVVALAIVVLTILQLKNNKETTQKRVYQYDKEKPISVQASTVKLERNENEYSYSGTFEPKKETRLSADIQGKVNDVLVDLGSVVRKGQTLIQLDNSLLKLQLQSIEVQLEGLEADVKRYDILAKADAVQGVQLEKAELGLKSAKVQKATLVEQIGKTEIKAPFNGVVTAKLTEEGAYAAPGVPLLQITNIATLKFNVNVPENELKRFFPGQLCKIVVDAYPEISLSGKVIMIGSKANMGNSYPVQLEIENTIDLKIKSGMFGKAGIQNSEKKLQIALPASTIVGSTIKPQVYLVRNGKALLQNITISERFENKVVVSEGLAEGDVIVTNGFINLFEGANVIVK